MSVRRTQYFDGQNGCIERVTALERSEALNVFREQSFYGVTLHYSPPQFRGRRNETTLLRPAVLAGAGEEVTATAPGVVTAGQEVGWLDPVYCDDV